MRLLKARRGDFTGADPAPGAFVAAPGTQRYQYDFVGNIRSTEILANANESTSAADRTLAASFNAANKQTNYVETVGHNGSSSASAYPALDTFGRTRSILWKADRIAREGYFDPTAIAALWSRTLDPARRSNGYEAWNVLMFQAWLDRWGSGGVGGKTS